MEEVSDRDALHLKTCNKDGYGLSLDPCDPCYCYWNYCSQNQVQNIQYAIIQKMPYDPSCSSRRCVIIFKKGQENTLSCFKALLRIIHIIDCSTIYVWVYDVVCKIFGTGLSKLNHCAAIFNFNSKFATLKWQLKNLVLTIHSHTHSHTLTFAITIAFKRFLSYNKFKN